MISQYDFNVGWFRDTQGSVNLIKDLVLVGNGFTKGKLAKNLSIFVVIVGLYVVQKAVVVVVAK